LIGVAFELARSAWIAQRVEPVDLPKRNAQLSMAGSVAETAAFALGGWLYQVLGAVLALLIDAMSYLASALLLGGVVDAASAQPPAVDASPWRAWWAEQREGWRVLMQQPRLRALGVIEALQGLGFSLAGTSYMVYVARDLALPTGIQGLVFALGSVGALAGAALAPRLGRALGSGRAMTFGLALLCVGAACIPLAQGAGALAIALLAAHQIVGDGGQTLHDVHDRTLRQTAVGAGLLARVDAGLRGIGQVATLIGAGLGGWIGTVLSARSVMAASSVVFGLAAVWAGVTLARRGAATTTG
jgi:hypothetical protein